jgi:hypothetical protein
MFASKTIHHNFSQFEVIFNLFDIQMEISNFDIEQKKQSPHHWLLPDSIRCILCGSSGKTNLLLNFLLKPGYLKYDRLHLYSKSLGQEKYQFLRDWASDLERVTGKEIASFHSSADDIIPVERLNPKERAIMVFDDVMHVKQGPIEPYFCQGQHGGAGAFYLTQNFVRVPRGAIRSNCNLLVFFEQDYIDVRTIYNTYVRGDVPIKEFYKFFAECTAESHGFCVIDLTSKVYDGKYRCGFDKFYIPKSSCDQTDNGGRAAGRELNTHLEIQIF